MFYKCLNNRTDTHTYWRGGNPCFLQTTTLNWLEVPLYAVTPPKKALLYPKCWMRYVPAGVSGGMSQVIVARLSPRMRLVWYHENLKKRNTYFTSL